MNLFLSPLAAAGLLLFGSLATAQSVSPRITLPHYAPDDPHLTLKDWRRANDQVEQAGGWKAYAREAAGAEKAPHAAPVDPSGNAGNPVLLTLRRALDLAMSAQPSLVQSLSGVNVQAPDYLRLSSAQRSALTKHAELVADVSRHYYAAVAAHERVVYQHQVTEAMAIAAELAGRMRSVGNLNAIHQSEEQLNYAKTVKELVKAEQAAVTARERLIRRLNLSGADATFSLPSKLPDLPTSPDTLSPLELRLTSEPPVTDTASALERLPASVSLRSEVRQAYSQYRRAYDLARHHRDEVLPLQRRISEEQLLRYNGMLIGVFELLADAKDQVKAVQEYLDALHIFWNAEADLTPKLAALKDHMTSFRRSTWTQ